jgi:ABC-type multidrug transport system permease subunit
VLPLTYLVNALRETMTKGGGFSDIWLDLAVMVATFAVGMVLAVRFFRWDSRPS